MDNFQDFMTVREIRESSLPDGTKLLLEQCYLAYKEAWTTWKKETKEDINLAMDFFIKNGGMSVTFAQEMDCRDFSDIHPLLPQIKRLTYTYINALNDFRSKRTSQSR